MNVPKFLRDDLPLFGNIILDLFPGVENPYIDRSHLTGAIHERGVELRQRFRWGVDRRALAETCTAASVACRSTWMHESQHPVRITVGVE